MNMITADFINNNTDFAELVEALKAGFGQGNIIVPQRHHHELEGQKEEATLLLMPAWEPGRDMGVKQVTVHPDNPLQQLTTIQGIYVYQDATNGLLKAILDAKSLTNKRTAAASALASSLLSRENSTILLQIGTGALTPDLIRAHVAVRPITQIYVWGRNRAKAEKICEHFQGQEVNANSDVFKVEAIDQIGDVLPSADIISTATLAEHALLNGDLIQPGQHLDLVGSFKPHMREADDQCIKRSSIFIDYPGATKESGDLYIPLAQGLITLDDIQADLHKLCAQQHSGRKSEEEITLFKSVGYGLEDLVGARYYFEKFKRLQ